MTRNGHPAVLARNDLLAIAEAWPDLLDRLGREGSSAPDGMPKPVSRTPGLVINEHVSQCMADVREWATFLARVLIDETPDFAAPGDTADLLRTLADRVGHFTEHPDDGMRLAFHDDLTTHLGKVLRVAYPDGYRTLDTRVPCEHHGDSAAGERVDCAGTYTVRPREDGSMPDLICDRDREHRVAPNVWSRSGWRREHDELGGVA